MGKVGNFFGDLKILLSAARLKSPPDESLDCMAKLVEVQARVVPSHLHSFAKANRSPGGS